MHGECTNLSVRFIRFFKALPYLVCVRFRYHKSVGEERKFNSIKVIFSSRNNYTQTGKNMKLITGFPHIFELYNHL